MSELTIANIIDSRSGKVLRLQGRWTGDDVQLLLNDSGSSWAGRFNLIEVDDETLSELKLERDEYLERMKSALGATTVHSKYKYTFEDGTLAWAKIVTPIVSIHHGSISFRSTVAATHGELVRSLLDSYSPVLEEVSENVARESRLEGDYEELSSAFEQCCQIRTEMENTLYDKFAKILNEKKDYVRRVISKEPTENFGPTTSSFLQSVATSRGTTAVSLTDLLKMAKKNTTGECPRKKRMLEPRPSTSRDYFDEMDM